MIEIKVHHDFAVPRERLWALLEDFAAIERWWPTDDPKVLIERVEIEGHGLGMIRHIYNVGFNDAVSERLDSLDSQAFTYSLSIVGNRPAGIKNYQAQGTLEVLNSNHSRLHYHSQLTAQIGCEAQAEGFLRGAYALMFKGLEQHA